MLALVTLLPDDYLTKHMEIDPSEVRQYAEFMSTVTTLSRQERRSHPHLRAVDQKISEFLSKDNVSAIQRHVKQMWDQYGGPELDAAIEHGILEIDQDWFFDIETNDIDQARLLEKLRSPDSHLLVDSQIQKVAEAAVREGLIEVPDAQSSRLRKTKAGTSMITHLPAFENAPVEDILEARAETRDYLGRYRTTVAQLAKQLQAEPFSPELSIEIEDLWFDEVLQRVIDMQQALEDSSLGGALKTAISNLPGSLPAIAGAGIITPSAIQLGVNALTNIESLIPAFTASALATGSAAWAGFQKDFKSSYGDSRMSKREAKEDGLFYLYSANQALS